MRLNSVLVKLGLPPIELPDLPSPPSDLMARLVEAEKELQVEDTKEETDDIA